MDSFNMLSKEIRRGITARQAYFNECDATLETTERSEDEVIKTIRILQTSDNEYDRRDNFEAETKKIKLNKQNNMNQEYYKNKPRFEDFLESE